MFKLGFVGVVVVAAGLVAGCEALSALRVLSAVGVQTPAPQQEDAAMPAPEVVVGTTRLVRARRVLPAHLEERDVEFETGAPVRMERLAGRLADLLAVNVVTEDRPARDGRTVALADPDPLRIVVTGTARDLLDEVAARSGYEWEYADARTPAGVVFYRYRDAAWRERLAPEPAPAPEASPAQTVWRIDPARHATVREVVEDWAAGAGWTVVWEAEGLDYSVTAKAVFHGTFEEAVDGLFRDTRGYRALIPTAYRANRYLTVRAGG